MGSAAPDLPRFFLPRLSQAGPSASPVSSPTSLCSKSIGNFPLERAERNHGRRPRYSRQFKFWQVRLRAPTAAGRGFTIYWSCCYNYSTSYRVVYSRISADAVDPCRSLLGGRRIQIQDMYEVLCIEICSRDASRYSTQTTEPNAGSPAAWPLHPAQRHATTDICPSPSMPLLSLPLCLCTKELQPPF